MMTKMTVLLFLLFLVNDIFASNRRFPSSCSMKCQLEWKMISPSKRQKCCQELLQLKKVQQKSFLPTTMTRNEIRGGVVNMSRILFQRGGANNIDNEEEIRLNDDDDDDTVIARDEADELISDFHARLQQIRIEMEAQALEEMMSIHSQIIQQQEQQQSHEEEEEKISGQEKYKMSSNEGYTNNHHVTNNTMLNNSNLINYDDDDDQSEYEDHGTTTQQPPKKDKGTSFVVGDTDESDNDVRQKLHSESKPQQPVVPHENGFNDSIKDGTLDAVTTQEQEQENTNNHKTWSGVAIIEKKDSQPLESPPPHHLNDTVVTKTLDDMDIETESRRYFESNSPRSTTTTLLRDELFQENNNNLEAMNLSCSEGEQHDESKHIPPITGSIPSNKSNQKSTTKKKRRKKKTQQQRKNKHKSVMAKKTAHDTTVPFVLQQRQVIAEKDIVKRHGSKIPFLLSWWKQQTMLQIAMMFLLLVVSLRVVLGEILSNGRMTNKS